MRSPVISSLSMILACGAASVSTEAMAAATGNRLSSVPSAFQGEWDEDLGGCGTKGRSSLSIGAAEIQYYITASKIKSIRQTGPRSIVVSVGRDDGWAATISYEVSADGRTLTETESGKRIRYSRCGSRVATHTPATGKILAAIPIVFQAKWREDLAQCGDMAEYGLDLSAQRVQYYSRSGPTKSVRQTGPRSIVVTYTAREDEFGTSEVSTVAYEISVDGRTLIEDGIRRVRCGSSSVQTTPLRPAPVAPLPQLRIGAYVSFPTRCAQASNATLEWWNGQFFSGGRKHPAYPHAIGPARPNGSQPFVAKVQGWEDTKTYRVNFLVLSPSMYERDGLRYFHCSDARLPPTWRNSTPPQSKAPHPPASTPATMAIQPPLPGADKLSFMDRRHAGPLATFLSQNNLLRMAQASDFWEWDQVRSQIRAQYANSHPYYAVGDFNRDRFEDFAVVLVDMAIGAKPRNYQGNESRYYNASVAVFNGSPSGYASHPNFMEKWGYVQSSLLLYSRNENFLGVGQWEGAVAQVKPERGGAYRYYFGE